MIVNGKEDATLHLFGFLNEHVLTSLDPRKFGYKKSKLNLFFVRDLHE